MLGKPTDSGRMGGDRRLFPEAVLWVARTGSPWRHLPSSVGRRNRVFKQFRDWVKADVFERMFEAVSGKPDMEYAVVDATIVRVHRHGQDTKGGTQSQAIGKSRSGLTTKVLTFTGASGNLLGTDLLPG